MFSNILKIAILGIILIAGFTSTAFARNEVINGIFRHGEQISPIQGDLGIAKWKMIRPDNGESMYFEKCWKADGGGWKCKYEVLFDGKTSPGSKQSTAKQADSTAVSNGNYHDQPKWSGVYPKSKKTTKGIEVSVTVNGKVQTDTFVHCEEGDGPAGIGLYCEVSTYVE